MKYYLPSASEAATSSKLDEETRASTGRRRRPRRGTSCPRGRALVLMATRPGRRRASRWRLAAPRRRRGRTAPSRGRAGRPSPGMPRRRLMVNLPNETGSGCLFSRGVLHRSIVQYIRLPQILAPCFICKRSQKSGISCRLLVSHCMLALRGAGPASSAAPLCAGSLSSSNTCVLLT